MRRFVLLLTLSAILTACSTAAETVTAGPDPEIIDRSTTQTSPPGGANATASVPVVQVLCTVRNNGESGAIDVLASVDSSVGSFTGRQTVTLVSDEERQIKFEFPEFDYQVFGNNGYEFSCGWELL